MKGVQGSGNVVHAPFRAAYGTKLFLFFRRFAETCGVYAGTFDDFDRFDAKLRNERLRLAGEFYKVEYCRPEPSF